MSSELDAQEIREIGQGEKITFAACFSPQLNGETISSVTSVTQISGPGTLTLGSGSVNTSGAVNVDGISRAVNTVVSYSVEAQAPSNSTDTTKALAGNYRVDVAIVTSTGQKRKLRCWFKVST